PQLGQRRLPRRAHHRGHGEGRLTTESQRPQREPGIRSKAGRRFSLPSPSSSYPFFLLLCALCDSVVSLLPLPPPWCYRAYPARPSEMRSPTVFPRLFTDTRLAGCWRCSLVPFWGFSPSPPRGIVSRRKGISRPDKRRMPCVPFSLCECFRSCWSCRP